MEYEARKLSGYHSQAAARALRALALMANEALDR